MNNDTIRPEPTPDTIHIPPSIIEQSQLYYDTDNEMDEMEAESILNHMIESFCVKYGHNPLHVKYVLVTFHLVLDPDEPDDDIDRCSRCSQVECECEPICSACCGKGCFCRDDDLPF